MTKDELERIKEDRKGEHDYECEQPFTCHERIDVLVRALERAWAEGDNAKQERAEGYGYLFRLLATVAPPCQPLDTVLGVATQIDNYISGLRQERDSLSKELLQIKSQLVECREVREMARAEIVTLKRALED